MSAERRAFSVLFFATILGGAASAGAEVPGLDVDVHGEPLLPSSEDATVASTVIDGDALARPGAAASDALAAAPSVRVSRTGSGTDLATVGLRGATNAETPVYLAGIKLNDELSGTADLSTVPLFFLRRITVFRGNAPFELPELGLGGAIVLEPDLPKRTRAGSGVGVGSFGERSAFVTASVGNRTAAAAFAVRGNRADNDYFYLDDRGTRFDGSDDRLVRRRNADATSIDAWAVARIRLGDRGSLTAVTNVLSREQGLTGLGVLPATAARATTRRSLFSVEARTRCDANPEDDTCELTASAYGKTTSYLYRDPRLELPFGAVREAVDSETAGYRVALHGRPARSVRVGGGIGQGFALLGIDPSGGVDVRARRATSRVFASAELTPTSWLTFALGASAAFSRTAGAERTGSLLAPEARVGASIKPLPELGFFADLARYERVPTLGETYGISASVLGNADLKPERGPSFEVGSRFSRSVSSVSRLAAEGVFFYRSAKDLIGYRRTSLGILRPYNVGSAHVLGGEISVAIELFDVLRVDSALTLTDARDDTQGRLLFNDALPFQASVADASRIHFYTDDVWPRIGLDRVTAGTTFLFRSARAADPAGLVELPRQLSWDADVSVGFDHGVLVARGRVSNLLDDRTTDAVGYPLPGRAGHFTLEAWWP